MLPGTPRTLAIIRVGQRLGWEPLAGVVQGAAEVAEPMGVHIIQSAFRAADPDHVGQVLGQMPKVGCKEAVSRIAQKSVPGCISVPLCFASHEPKVFVIICPSRGPADG